MENITNQPQRLIIEIATVAMNEREALEIVSQQKCYVMNQSNFKWYGDFVDGNSTG